MPSDDLKRRIDELDGTIHGALKAALKVCPGHGSRRQESSEVAGYRPQASPPPEQQMPYLNVRGHLVIPFSTPVKYHWWREGQSVSATLAELKARITTQSPPHGGEQANSKELRHEELSV